MNSANDIPNSQFFDFYISLQNDDILGKVTGENLRNVLVALHPVPDDGLKGFLAKILSAVEIDIDKDIALLNLDSSLPISLVPAAKSLDAKVLLVFGLNAHSCGMNLNLKPYQPLEHLGIQILLCDQLSELATNQQLKRQLWSALQQIFFKKDA